ncbi:MAG: arginine deiminase-related protein [Chitinophagaceae bacterium]|jgi:hypothetical protein
MTQQNTGNIFMVRPANFGFNEQTALSNTFQQDGAHISNVQQKAKQEFDSAVEKLRSAGINVWVIEDTDDSIRPDAVFPNNWISTHENGTIILYPMLTENRRKERRSDIVDTLRQNYFVSKILDFSNYENKHQFVEGTGSIVFDHTNRFAYACISPRTNKELLEEICSAINYKSITFRAVNQSGIEIYHTNVLMSIGEDFAIICLECIADEKERSNIKDSIEKSGKEIIEIRFDQMNSFAGNAISLSSDQKNILALSQTAYNSLIPEQKIRLEQYCTLLPVRIPTIETIGGGSLRCMIAQNFLPVR